MYSTSAYDSISSCNISTALEINPSSSHFRVQITLRDKNQSIAMAAMVDSGATALFMNKNFTWQHSIYRHFPYESLLVSSTSMGLGIKLGKSHILLVPNYQLMGMSNGQIFL